MIFQFPSIKSKFQIHLHLKNIYESLEILMGMVVKNIHETFCWEGFKKWVTIGVQLIPHLYPIIRIRLNYIILLRIKTIIKSPFPTCHCMIFQLRCLSNIYIQPVHDPYTRRVILWGRRTLHKNRRMTQQIDYSVSWQSQVRLEPKQCFIVHLRQWLGETGWESEREGKANGERGRNVHTHFVLIILCEDLTELLHPHVCLLLKKHKPGWIFSKGVR